MDPASSSLPAKGVSAGDVVGEAFSIYRDNLGALLGSAIAVFLVVGLLSALLENTDSVALALIGALIGLAGHALYTGFVVKLVQDVRDGRRDDTVGDLFSAAAPAILPLIVFGILYAIGVGIGFLLLVVPGLFLLTFWSLGPPAIVVERVGPIEAFRRSWRLVKGEGWSVFATLLVVLLIVLGVGIVLGIVAAAIGDSDAAAYVASIIANAVTAPIFALAVSIMYFDLGGGREAGATVAPGEPPMAPPAA
ncbi:MAG TPA: YciC family protein [Solirubrobacterales bacterium]|jgi:hypothetical protein